MAQFLSCSFLLAVAIAADRAFRSGQAGFAGTSQLPRLGPLPKRESRHMARLLLVLLAIFGLTPAVWAQAVGFDWRDRNGSGRGRGPQCQNYSY